MASVSKTCTILEKSLVKPQTNVSEEDVKQQTLVLTFLDIKWINFYPIQRLIFYKFPSCSKSQFLEIIVPSFKTSLSKTLKHYLPLSGNLYYPTTDGSSNTPEIRYKHGHDSVPVTVAEYSSDENNTSTYFDYLTGNFQRGCVDFYAFLPNLPDPKTEPDFLLIPLFAVQITLFPGVGLCVGFTNQHVLGDANSIVGFIKAWCKVAKFGAYNDELIPLPSYDRSVMKDPKGLTNIYWAIWKERKYQSPAPSKDLPIDTVRATYTLQESDIKKLKDLVKSKKPDIGHLSSFTVATAYAWTSLTKSAPEAGEQVHDSDEEHLLIPVDARTRLDPPLPVTYFGNCISPAFAQTTHGNLRGEEGFLNAVESISNMMTNTVNKKNELFKDADRMSQKFASLAGKRVLSVAGSPKFDLYDVDFGWGKPIKFETLSVDGERAISICTSGEFQGGLEIGLALPKKKMDAFAQCFYGGFKDLNL